MEHIVIKGQNKLNGEVQINGAKNAALAIIPAALCSRSVCRIDNVPNIADVVTIIDALKKLGVSCKFVSKHCLEVDATSLENQSAGFDSLKKIRGSYYLIGVFLGLFKRAEVALPGGCNFGSRPIDQHIKGFEALGAKVVIEHGMVKVYADKLIGTTIYLDMASVGATINIMFAAIFAEGVTIIENAAKEPHIVDTANFLNMLGAKVKGAGTDTIKITGVTNLHGCEYTIIPDQIEAGTYMMAAAITGGNVKINNIIPKHMDSLTAKLREMNCKIEEGDDYIRVNADVPLKAVNVKTLVYPGFPTDLQPQITTLIAVAKGNGKITETVFDNRFQYVSELKRLGAKITVEARVAFVEGIEKYSGAKVTAIDLRAGASLVMAGLAAEGTTTISNIKLINRGYEDIVKKLSDLGADICIKDLPENAE